MAWPGPPKTWVAGDRGNSANLNAQLRDALMAGPNGGNLAALGTSIGTPAAGAHGVVLVLANTTQWDIPLWHDGTKWRSQIYPLLGNQSGAINGTGYATLAATALPNPNASGFTLVPYWRVRGFVSAASGAETTTVAISYAEFANTGTEPATGVEFGAVTSASATQSYLDTGFVTTATGSSLGFMEVFIRIKSSGAVAAKTQSRFSLELQWRSS